MHTARPPTAQNCQMITAHNSTATGKATTNPFAKLRFPGGRAIPDFKAIGCRLLMSVKSRIADLLSRDLDSVMTYVCETFKTTQVRRTGIFASCNAVELNFQSDTGTGIPNPFKAGTRPQLIQMISPAMALSRPVISAFGKHHVLTRKARGSTGFEAAQLQNSDNLGDRK